MASTSQNIRQVDGKGRVTLPPGFANCVVLVEQVDENTLILRKARVVPMGRDVLVSVDDTPALAEVLSRPPQPENVFKLSERDTKAIEENLAEPKRRPKRKK